LTPVVVETTGGLFFRQPQLARNAVLAPASVAAWRNHAGLIRTRLIHRPVLTGQCEPRWTRDFGPKLKLWRPPFAWNRIGPFSFFALSLAIWRVVSWQQRTGGVMATEKECIEYARECVRLAGLANEPDIRERLLDIAREWMAAAMHEDVPMKAAPSISVSENKGTKSRPCA
jgi:hypothetical protein